jgi:hypothetical protein
MLLGRKNHHKSKTKPNSRKGIYLVFDKKRYSYIIIDTENKKIKYINNTKFIE